MYNSEKSRKMIFIDKGGAGVTGLLGSLKISHRRDRRLKDTQNPKCKNRKLQICLALMTEDFLATKPDDQRFEFLIGKI